MKNHNEVVRDVFARRDEILKQRKKNLRVFIPTLAALILLSAVIASVVLIANRSAAPSDTPGKSGDTETSAQSDGEPGQETSGENPVIREESGIQTDPGTSADPQHEDPQYEEPEIPDTFDWYEPGTLEVNTLVRETLKTEPMASFFLFDEVKPAVELGGISEGQFAQIVGARFVDVTGLSQTSEHKDHGCLVFDIEKKELVCLTCTIRAALANNGIATDDLIAVDNLENFSEISFALFNEAKNKMSARYILNTETGSLKKMPVLCDNDIGGLICAPDMAHLLTFVPRDSAEDYDDVFLIDTATGAYKQIAAGKPTFYSGMFSPDGKNVLLLLKNKYGTTNNFSSTKCNFLLYNIQNGNLSECTGKVVTFRDGELITETEDGYNVYDLSTCEKVTPKPGTFVVEATPGTNCRYGTISCVDVATGKEMLLANNVDMMLVSPDGKYLYTYRTGYTSICCNNIGTDERFHVEVPEAFYKAVAKIKESGNYDLFYQPGLSGQMDELILCYYTAQRSPGDDDTHEAGELASRWRRSLWDNYVASSSIRELYERLSADPDFSPEMFSAGCKDGQDAKLAVTLGNLDYVFVEDYRSKTFTGYMQNLIASLSSVPLRIAPFELEGGDRRVVPLSSTEAQTKAFISETGFASFSVPFDYADLYENGEFSDRLAAELLYSDLYFDATTGFTCFLAGNPGCECNDTELLKTFIKEFRECDRKHVNGNVNRDDYATLFYGGIRMIAMRQGNRFYIMSGEDCFEVPEYVFADLVSLCASVCIRPFSGITNPQTEIGKLYFGDNTAKKKLTEKELQKLMLSAKHISVTLQDYRSAVLSEINNQYVRVIFPLYGDGEESDSFLFACFHARTGQLERLLQFDDQYRLVADLLYGETPSVKGKMTFGQEWTFTDPGVYIPGTGEQNASIIEEMVSEIADEMNYKSFGTLGAKLRNNYPGMFTWQVFKREGSELPLSCPTDIWEGALLAGVTWRFPAEFADETVYFYLSEAETLLTLVPVYDSWGTDEIDIFDYCIDGMIDLPIEKLDDFLHIVLRVE